MNVRASVSLMSLALVTAACSSGGGTSETATPTATTTRQAGEPTRPVLRSEWKAVIDDWYQDGVFDDAHRCAAVREAIERLPSSTPQGISFREDFRSFERRICAAASSRERRFGYIRAIDLEATPPTISFDAADFLSGKTATQAAFEDGAIASADEPVPNDYYIRNPDPTAVTLPVAAAVRVTAVRCPNSCGEGIPGNFEALAASFGPGEKSLADDYRGAATQYWITVVNGSVMTIDEKYLP